MSVEYLPAVMIAAEEEQQRHQEEEMTSYRADDLDGWEFKIVRSIFGRFSNRGFLERVRAEEAQAGWELVEKFDDQRVRFKRRIEERTQDAHRTVDPYRTSISMGSKPAVMISVGGLALLAGVAVFLFMMLR